MTTWRPRSSYNHPRMSETQMASLGAGLIRERPLCVDCITLRASPTVAAVESHPAALPRVVEVRRERARCRACGITSCPRCQHVVPIPERQARYEEITRPDSGSCLSTSGRGRSGRARR